MPNHIGIFDTFDCLKMKIVLMTEEIITNVKRDTIERKYIY